MSSRSSKRPEPCGHEGCGSRRFHLGNDGFTYCDRGHQQSERGTVVAENTGEFVIAGRKARRKDSDAESTTSRASGFSGPRAFEHYLLCLQLVLRKQLRWLVETKKLPEELEALVRDLWALRLQKLQNRVSYDSETETETQSHYFSSQSEGETSASEVSRRSRTRSRTRLKGTPGLLDMLAICYVGMLLLREPVTTADLYGWAYNGELLYYRASKEVPLGMRVRLPPRYQKLLEANPLGKPEELHQNVLEMLTLLSAGFGMALPSVNHPLLLYRWTRELSLPVEVFAATSRLARLLDIDFGFKLDTKAGTKDVMLRYPEPRLMAVLVVATKLMFPFDDIKRSPASATAMDALGMNWSAWAELRSPQTADGEATRPLGYVEALDFSQSDVPTAAEHQLDQYMDWFEHNIASEDIREHGKAGRDADSRRILFRMFPAHEGGATQHGDQSSVSQHEDVTTERLREAQTALKPKKIVKLPRHRQDGANRLGSFYRRIRSVEGLEGPAKLFHERAAQLAGLSVDGMIKAVLLVESKLQKHETRLRKGEGA